MWNCRMRKKLGAAGGGGAEEGLDPKQHELLLL